MDEEYLKESFNGLGEKHSTAESSLTLRFDSGNLSTACESEKTPKHKASHDNADSAVVERWDKIANVSSPSFGIYNLTL